MTVTFGDLVTFLTESNVERKCRATFEFTRSFLEGKLDEETINDILGHITSHTGGCDCEILRNSESFSRDWVLIP